jgi:hypothetical protein
MENDEVTKKDAVTGTWKEFAGTVKGKGLVCCGHLSTSDKCAQRRWERSSTTTASA